MSPENDEQPETDVSQPPDAELAQVHTAAQDAIAEIATEAEEASNQIAEQAKRAEDATVEAQEHLVRAKEYVESAKEKALEATSAANETTRLKGQAETAAAATKQHETTASTAATQATTAQAAADTALAETKERKKQSEQVLRAARQAGKATDGLAKISRETETRVAKYERDLQGLIDTKSEELKDLTEQIEGLLPGATSAGLAAGFDERMRALVKSRRLWMVLFFLSLGGLAGLSLWLGSGLLQESRDWHLLALTFLGRVIVIAPVLWLALLSARQLKTLLRLEEEYAHKVVVANSFEGYRRELKGVSGEPSPLASLTDAVLTVLRRSPVRLYDGKQSADSPEEVLADQSEKSLETLAKLADIARKFKA